MEEVGLIAVMNYGSHIRTAVRAVDFGGRKVALIQYLLCYCVLVTGNSYLMSYFVEPYVNLLSIVVIAIALFIPKYWHFRDVAFVTSVLVISMITRCIVGGAGITVFTRYTLTIGLIVLAVKISPTTFLKRMIRVVCFLTAVSLVLYFARIAVPGLYYMLPFYEFESQGTYYSMATASSVNFNTKGLFLCCIREGETRNIGIFTEPGVFQGVLTAALFCDMFMHERMGASDRERAVSAFIILLGIATCGSTTGFISLFVMLLFYYLLPSGDLHARSSSIDRGFKRYLFMLLALGLVALMCDFYIRGDASILVESVFNKLFSSSGTLSVNQGNGAVRLDSVAASLELLSQHPFGVGFDNVQAYKGALSVGAGLFTTTAALGFPFALAYLYWLLAPVFRSRLGAAAICSYLFLYFNFAVSQSLVLTPLLVSISIYFALCYEEAGTNEDCMAVQRARSSDKRGARA